jgi:hypothetical protein
VASWRDLSLKVVSGLSIGMAVAILHDDLVVANGRLVAPIMGATVALLIAFVAYPWQKQRDRESEVMRERRSAYVEYAAAAKDLVFAQPYSGDEPINREYLTIGDREKRFYTARDVIYILAPQTVVEKMMDHEKSLRNYLIVHSNFLQGEPVDKMPREYAPIETANFQELLIEFRNDIQSHSARPEK